MAEDSESFLKIIEDRVGEYPLTSGIATFLNPYSYQIVKSECSRIAEFDRVFIDGSLLCKLLEFAGIHVVRVSFDMTGLAPSVLEEASSIEADVTLVGGKVGVAADAAKVLNMRYPGIRFDTHCGYFESNSERQLVIDRIVARKPEYVIVGMGAGKQEELLLNLQDCGWRGIGYTCGAFLEQTSKGGLVYYPQTINRLNLRWLYRVFKNPRLVNRYFCQYPVAVGKIILDIIQHRRQMT